MIEPITSKFLSSVRDLPDRPILIFPDETVSYQELHDRALKIAKSLHSMDIRRGDHVGILMANSIEYVEVLFGIAFLLTNKKFIYKCCKTKTKKIYPESFNINK